MINFLTHLGEVSSATAMLAIVLFVWFGVNGFGVFVDWQCPNCGKFNRTTLFKAMVFWCDHTPDA